MISAGDIVARLRLDSNPFKREMKKTEGDVSRHTKTITQRMTEAGNSWWNTYGRVALGFTVAYRAMNAFERGLTELIGSFGEAVQEAGELASFQAKLAMFYKLSSGSMEDFSTVFEKAAGNVDALAEASIRSMSPLSDLTTGFDELAQAGVIVNKEMTPAFTSLVSFTKLVAQTTGSSMRQVRQEFQALAEGRIRTTDILIRTMKRFGVLTKENLQDLRDQVNTQETIEKVARKVHEQWKKVKEVLISSDVTVAMEYWNKNLRAISRVAITTASELEGKGNIFAKIFAKHAEGFWETFKEEDMARYVSIVQDLAKALDWVLASFDSFFRSLLKGWVFIRNFFVDLGKLRDRFEKLDRVVGFLTKAFMTLMSVRLVTFVLKELGMIVTWLALHPLKVLIRLLGVLGSRIFLIPALVVAATTAIFSFGHTLVDMWPKIKDKVKGFLDWIKKYARYIWAALVADFWGILSKIDFPGKKLDSAIEAAYKKTIALRNYYELAASGKSGRPGDDFGESFGESFLDAFKQKVKDNIAQIIDSIVKDLKPALEAIKKAFPSLALPGNLDEIIAQLNKAVSNLELGKIDLGGKKGEGETLKEKTDDLERALQLMVKMYEEAGGERLKVAKEQADLEYEVRKNLIKRMEISENLRNELFILAEKAHKERLLVVEGSFVDGVKAGLKDLRDSFKSTFENARDIVKGAVGAMRTFFEDGFFAMMKLNLDSLEDAWMSFVTSIQRMVAELLAEQLMLALFKKDSGILSGLGTLLNIKQNQSGGWIPEPVFGMGLSSGRAYSFAEKGPEMVTPGGGGMGMPTKIEIHAVDAKSFVDLTRRNPAAITGPFMDELRKGNRGLRSSLKGVS